MTADQDIMTPELAAELARVTGKTVDEAMAMTKDDLIDWTARSSFVSFGLKVACDHEEAAGVTLMDEGPRAQGERAAAQLERFHDKIARLYPVDSWGIEINLFGFGQAPVHYVTFDADGKTDVQYLLLSEVAEALAVPLQRADEWARADELDAIRSQRERDEETGVIGWECLRDLVDLRLDMIIDDPDAKPDADGRRWSHAGDWLISRDRCLAFMTISPWQKEFLDNASALFGYAFRESGLGERLKDVPTYTGDGEPTGTSAADFLCDTEGLTVEEAAERAMRGPSAERRRRDFRVIEGRSEEGTP